MLTRSAALFSGIVALFFAWSTASIATDETLTIYVFGRDDCGYCQAEKAFFDNQSATWEYLNVVEDPAATELFYQVVEKHDLPKVTPVTVVGTRVWQGFNGSDTTGAEIMLAYEAQRDGSVRTLEDHLAFAPAQTVIVEAGCDEQGVSCNTAEPMIFDLPLLGLVDLKSFSLISLAAILGTIDGFNPCAMWVLITFLILLSQAGSRKKMVLLAGVFIVAEGVMYNLILNVWYQAWDFVALDQIVTPLVGFIALGGGLFFLYRWYKNRDAALVCDISSIESQTKTLNKLQSIINQPVTILSLLAILVIAFSVNIIEFACSIGIPQAFTKILEINALSFVERQFYILIYTIGYMVDDLIVFGLAIWGFSKLEAHGHKYAQLSLLIGGVLMLLLGAILVVNPQLLVL